MNAPDYQLIRVRITRTDDGGEYQKVWATGRDGEVLGGQTGLLRAQYFGSSEHVPKDAHGLALVIGGNLDQAVLLGFEHPDHRPTGLAEGDKKIYDAFGQFMHFEDGKCTISAGGCEIVMEGGICTIKAGRINLGDGASRPVSAQGTVDSAGHVETSNFLTKVWGS